MEAILTNNISAAAPKAYVKFILPALAFLLAICLLKDYFIPGIQIAFGIMLAPFIFKVQKGSFSWRYAYISLFFLIAYYFIHIYMLLFFSIGCLILFTIESQSGKTGILPFLFLICISPTMHYVVNVFTFSIRLELSKYSAIILNKVGLAVENKGTYFMMPDGSVFSVDTACIGLNMFNTGFALTLLMIGFSEQKLQKKIGLSSLILILLVSIVLLILTNLLRIIALVFFKSEPGTMHHDLIGIVSLVLYTIVPVYFLVFFLNKRYGISKSDQFSYEIPSFMKNATITVCLSTALFMTSTYVKEYLKITVKDQKVTALILPGFAKQLKEDGVAEFKKDSVLIYVKPASRAYESDHPPTMCWQGSGFKLEKITEVNYSGFTVLTAILKKDDIVQYTAWWYDNGMNKTSSQWEWRFSQGEPYRIINITTKNKKDLDGLCNFYIRQKLF